MAQGDKTIFSKEIQADADQAQDLENAIWAVKDARSVENATGATLDYIGEVVGCNRPTGYEDESYRLLIKAQIQMNASGGEPERLIAGVVALAGASWVRYMDYYPCMVSLEFAGTAIANLWTLIKRIVAGGVWLRFVQADGANAFQFDVGPGFDVGEFSNLLQ